jgi:hypothetical protein
MEISTFLTAHELQGDLDKMKPNELSLGPEGPKRIVGPKGPEGPKGPKMIINEQS